jgi:ribulose 1,5-bisphosphate synthetase/thiazole synthase
MKQFDVAIIGGGISGLVAEHIPWDDEPITEEDLHANRES